MKSLNRIVMIGRLCRDSECRTFANGGKVANFSFACNNSKKVNGQWEDDPCFIDVAAFNYGQTGTLANIVEQYCRKGSLIALEGRLTLETWTDKTSGQKRSKHKIVADSIQLLDTKSDKAAPAASNNDGPPASDTNGNADDGESIPF